MLAKHAYSSKKQTVLLFAAICMLGGHRRLPDLLARFADLDMILLVRFADLDLIYVWAGRDFAC